jgi:hypothetical protein
VRVSAGACRVDEASRGAGGASGGRVEQPWRLGLESDVDKSVFYFFAFHCCDLCSRASTLYLRLNVK